MPFEFLLDERVRLAHNVYVVLFRGECSCAPESCNSPGVNVVLGHNVAALHEFVAHILAKLGNPWKPPGKLFGRERARTPAVHDSTCLRIRC